jgi:hypothetical protein
MKKYINKILRESLNKILLKEDIDGNLFFMNIKQIIEQLTKVSSFLMRNTIDKSLVDKINEAQSIISDLHQTLYVGSKRHGYGGLLNFRKKINENIKIPKIVTSIRETIKELKDILFLDKGEINNLLNNGYEKEYNDILRAKNIINEIYEFISGNGSVKNVVKPDEPKEEKPKEVTNLFGEPFDINISGTYYEGGFNTHRYGGTEIGDVRSIIKRPLFEPIFTDSVQEKKAFGTNEPLPEKKVFTLIDGLTKDSAGRRGAHTISFVFDKDSKITLDDVKGELEKLNKEININYKEGKDENVSFEERRNNYDRLYRNYFFNTKFKPNATKYILKFIDDYVKKHNNPLS